MKLSETAFEGTRTMIPNCSIIFEPDIKQTLIYKL